MGWWHNSAAIEILQKIADNTSRHETMWIAIIGAAAGLIGAAIGGAGGYFGVKRTTASHERIETARMRVEVVTAERLRWLQDLRQRLSQLYVEMDMQYNILQRPVPIGGAAAVQAEHDAMSRKVMEQCNMIMLMLNPARQQQEALRQALTQALAFMMAAFRNYGPAPQAADEAYMRIKTAAFDALTRIGAETWAKIKAEAGANTG